MAATLRVLYVDDEPDLLNIGKLFLERSGDFTVTTALSAPDAIRLLEQKQVDAIISDYQMPGMDGIQFLVEVRTRFGPIPFILFTGRGREEVVIQAINSGVDFYLQKGGDPRAQFAELAHKVKQATFRKGVEKALAESERVYQTMISNLPGFVYRCANDPDWTMEYISDGCREITGYSPDELLNNKSRTYNDLIHPEFQKALWDNVQEFLEKKEVIEVEYPIITKTGETRWVWERGRGIYSDDRRLLYLEGFITDITGSKRAEAELLESNERYKSLITVSNTGAWEYNRDRDYLWFSPEYFLMLGRDAKVFDSSGAANLKETWIDLLHPDDRGLAIEHFSQYLDSGSPGIYENHFRMQHDDGHWVWIWSRGWTLRDKNGALTNKTIGTHIDVTESKRTEEARRINNEHLRLAQEIGETGSWELDFATGLIWGSEEAFKIFEIPRPADGILSLKEVEDRIPERERVHRALLDLIETGAEYNIEYAIASDDNSSLKVVHSSARILTDAENKPVRIAGVTQDVTGLRKAEVALLHQSKMLSILNDIITTANQADDLAHLLDSILTKSLRLLDFDAGGIYLVDRSTRTANVVHSINLPKEFLVDIQATPIDKKPYDMLFIKNEPIITEDYAKISPALSKQFGFLSIASIPLLSKGIAIGALNIASMRRHVISEEEKQTLISISGELGSTIERMVAEEEAKNASKNLETLFNSIDEMVFVLDMQGRIIVVNNAVLKRLLYTPEELTGMDVLQLHVPELRNDALRYVQGMIAGTIDTCPVPVLAKDGTRIDVETKVTRGLWNGKEVLIGVSREITERKMAEETLKESEEFNRNLVENLPDYIIVYRPDGKILYVNPATVKGFGYNLNELVGTSVISYVAPECRTRVTATIATRLKGDDTPEYETVLITKEGQRKTVIAKGTMVHYHDGLATLLLLTDITERKVAEETLWKKEEYYRTILQTTKDGFWIIDAHTGRFKEVNETYCAMSGYAKTELLNMGINDIDSIEDPIKTQNRIQRILTNGSELFETRHRRKDGSLLTVEISVTHFPAEGGNFICFCRDITERKVAEEALQESELRLKDIIDFSPDATLVIDKNGEVLAWNRAMEVMTGVPADQMIGKADYEYALPFYHERCPITVDLVLHDELAAAAKYSVIKREGKSLYSEIFIPHLNNGRGAYLWLMASPLYDMAGNLTGAIETIRDITERKRAEAAITESFAIFKTVMDSLDALVYVSDMQTHEILFINQYGKENFGDITGKICWKSIQVDQNGPCPFCTNEKLMDLEGNPAGIIVWEFKNTINGHWYECHDSAIRWTDGRIVRIEIASDITGRKRVQEALAESESFNRGLVENLPDYIAVYGMDGKLLYVNPASARTLGYDAETLIGTHVLSYIAEEYHETVIAKMTVRKKRGEASPYEIEMVTRNGLRRSVIVKATQIKYHDNPATLLLLIDITDRKHAEEALIVANKKLNLLSSITRHDINNQLTVLMGFLTILKKKQPDPSLNDYFVKVSNAAQRISSMVQFTREYENIGVNAPEWQDCRRLVDTAAKDAPLGKVIVKNDLPVGAEVFADPLVVKVFYNLMDNAVRYGGKITTIRFSVQESVDGPLMICEDDGDGVVAEEKEKIFERGFGKNTGLGLALAREILDITGITIKETGEPGQGARFDMTVPKGAWRTAGQGD